MATGAQNSGGFGVGGGDGQSKEGAEEEGACAGQVGGQALPGVQDHHVPTHSINDSLPTEGGAQGYGACAQGGEPQRGVSVGDIPPGG